ncbi:MAG: hypothetical protein H0V74_08740 [Chloroflexi bacterium]|nr:hypothetical protein [Chloroflexota bacterium]
MIDPGPTVAALADALTAAAPTLDAGENSAGHDRFARSNASSTEFAMRSKSRAPVPAA